VKKRKKRHDGEQLTLHELVQREGEYSQTGAARRKTASGDRVLQSGQPGLLGLTPGQAHGYGRVRHRVRLLGWQASWATVRLALD
jgi:hypothetical protein